MTGLPQKKKYTPAEYLALEEKAETRSEYWNGEIVAMAGGNITATVTLGGVCSCERTASETGGIDRPRVVSRETDRFRTLSNDDVRARIDNLYIELSNDPTAQGYIINYGTARQIAARERQIRNAISFRRLDASRVTLVRGGDDGSGVESVFFVVPSGAEPPTPER